MADYFGVAQWFNCGSASFCGPCDNTTKKAAYPNTMKPGQTIDVTGCNYPMEAQWCGESVVVTNPCNGKYESGLIADAGPNVSSFCGVRAPDCSPSAYYDVIIDLTPPFFTALAPLDQGRFSAKVTTF